MNEFEIRKEKLNKLRAKGINPYPYFFDRTHNTSEVKNDFSSLVANKIEVKVCGRILSKRIHGKTSFYTIADRSGSLQIYFRKDILFDKFELLELFDIGDFIGVSGEVFKTKTGEITVLVKDFLLLAKALSPLSEKWHGLKDTEARYRQRYLDLIANPSVKEIFLTRSKIINLIREFLNARGFIEVETPILQPLYGGAFALPFKTFYESLNQEVYLRISNELYLKRLLVGGLEKVYEIGKDFRNEGISRFHNPEFTQIEIYEAYKDYHGMAELTEDLFLFIAKNLYNKETIEYQGEKISFKKPWKKISFTEALEAKIKKDVLKTSFSELKKIALDFGIEVKEKTTFAKLLDKLFSNLVQPELIEPTFVCDHPKITTPLAKVCRNNSLLCERFEPIVCGIELGNAFSEENDPIEQRRRFEELISAKEDETPIDEDFIKALEQGMPPTAGLGLGIDRMVMLFTNQTSIREVILFPQLRPVVEE